MSQNGEGRRVKAPPAIRLGKIYRLAFDLKHIVNLELMSRRPR